LKTSKGLWGALPPFLNAGLGENKSFVSFPTLVGREKGRHGSAGGLKRKKQFQKLMGQNKRFATFQTLVGQEKDGFLKKHLTRQTGRHRINRKHKRR